MCMEDVRIGRKSSGTVTPVTCTTAAQLAVPGVANRTALILGAPSTGNVCYSTSPTVAAGTGFNLSSNSGQMDLTIQSHGDLVRQAWYVIGAAGGELVSIGQVFLVEQ